MVAIAFISLETGRHTFAFDAIKRGETDLACGSHRRLKAALRPLACFQPWAQTGRN
jgi:hypothetical protein